VNDTFGHGLGDELLKEVADRLRETALREDDICGRLGGDEFAIIRKNLLTPLDLDAWPRGVIAELSQGYILRGRRSASASASGARSRAPRSTAARR
jgi:GGDEF domain-containing protein